jgi:hypothetical protein
MSDETTTVGQAETSTSRGDDEVYVVDVEQMKQEIRTKIEEQAEEEGWQPADDEKPEAEKKEPEKPKRKRKARAKKEEPKPEPEPKAEKDEPKQEAKKQEKQPEPSAEDADAGEATEAEKETQDWLIPYLKDAAKDISGMDEERARSFGSRENLEEFLIRDVKLQHTDRPDLAEKYGVDMPKQDKKPARPSTGDVPESVEAWEPDWSAATPEDVPMDRQVIDNLQGMQTHILGKVNVQVDEMKQAIGNMAREFKGAMEALQKAALIDFAATRLGEPYAEKLGTLPTLLMRGDDPHYAEREQLYNTLETLVGQGRHKGTLLADLIEEAGRVRYGVKDEKTIRDETRKEVRDKARQRAQLATTEPDDRAAARDRTPDTPDAQAVKTISRILGNVQ